MISYLNCLSRKIMKAKIYCNILISWKQWCLGHLSIARVQLMSADMIIAKKAPTLTWWSTKSTPVWVFLLNNSTQSKTKEKDKITASTTLDSTQEHHTRSMPIRDKCWNHWAISRVSVPASDLIKDKKII